MSLDTIIKRASEIDRAMGKREAYLHVMCYLTRAKCDVQDRAVKDALDAAYESVSKMDDSAKAEYDAAREAFNAT